MFNFTDMNNYAFIDSQKLNLGIRELAGYILIFKPTLKVNKKKKIVIKGNVDAELVLHTMIEFSHYDKAIIVSGDGDFHCLIEYLINKNKLLYLLIPNPNKYSSLLRKFRSYFQYINNAQKK